MKPSDCKTREEAAAAGDAIFDARIIVRKHLKRAGMTGYGAIGEVIDDELHEMQHGYYSVEAAREAKKQKRKKAGRRAKR